MYGGANAVPEACAAMGVPKAAWGSFEQAEQELWQCNVAAINLMACMQTQWRVGMAGPTGLDYAALPAVMDLQGVPAADRRALFDDLRVCEGAALKVINDGRQQHKDRH